MAKTHRRKRRIRKTQKGGKVSGRGAFGCVIQPPIPCSNTITPSHPNISQLAVKLYAPTVDSRNKYRLNHNFPTEEVKAAEILRRIPTALNYFVIPFAHCDITETDVERHENSRDCAEQMKLYPKILLWMEAAEGDLWRSAFEGTLYTDYEAAEILYALRNILLGIQLLHENGIVHRDIKADNILYGKMKGSLWIKIADFGEALLDASDFQELAAEDIRNLSYIFRLVFSKIGAKTSESQAFLQSLQTAQPLSESLRLYEAFLAAI